MLESAKVALDPTPRQERLMLSHAGAARFAYNAGLAHVKKQLDDQRPFDWSYYALRKWWNRAKRTLAVDEAGDPWWQKNSKEAANTGLEALAAALKNFSDSRKGKRRGRRVGFPKFKDKAVTVPRFACTTGFHVTSMDPHSIRLPKIGRVHCMENIIARIGAARVMRITVTRRGGRWYAAFTLDVPDMAESRPGGQHKRGTVGVDMGIKTLATFSDGTRIENPHALRRGIRKLAKLQHSLSRKTKGSNRRSKTRLQLAKQHARVAHVREDTLHKLTTFLATTYDTVCIEDLNVQGMMRNHRLAQAVDDAGFGMIRRQLEYKCHKFGGVLRVIDRYYPSSKTCSRCGMVKTKLSLRERTYRCDSCGLLIDRDLNAAINIQVAGSAPETINAHGGDARQTEPVRTMQSPSKCEPSGRPSPDDVRLGAGFGNKTM